MGNKTNKVPDYVPQEEKTDTKKDEPPLWYMIIMVPLIIIVGLFLLIKFIDSKPIDKAKGFIDDRSSKKVECAERAEDASNSYAAKKLYKACMSR